MRVEMMRKRLPRIGAMKVAANGREWNAKKRFREARRLQSFTLLSYPFTRGVKKSI